MHCLAQQQESDRPHFDAGQRSWRDCSCFYRDRVCQAAFAYDGYAGKCDRTLGSLYEDLFYGDAGDAAI